MTKILQAQCSANLVVADGLPLTSAQVLSEGVGQSEGIALLDEDKAWYIAKGSPDLKTTLEHLIAALTQVKTALDQTVEACNKAGSALQTLDTSAFLTGATGAVPSPPVAASDIAGITTATGQVTSAATQIETIKGQLETLKGVLI